MAGLVAIQIAVYVGSPHRPEPGISYIYNSGKTIWGLIVRHQILPEYCKTVWMRSADMGSPATEEFDHTLTGFIQILCIIYFLILMAGWLLSIRQVYQGTGKDPKSETVKGPGAEREMAKRGQNWWTGWHGGPVAEFCNTRQSRVPFQRPR